MTSFPKPERHTVTSITDWQGVTLSVAYTAAYFVTTRPTPSAMAHLEIRSIAPERAPLPITETGYLSHFIHPDEVDCAGGAVAYVLAWLEESAKSPLWRNRKSAPSQLSLF